MYAAYALSSIMSPTSSLMDMRAAGAIPALISVLNTSKVSLTPPCCCSCAAQTWSGPPEVDLTQSTGREVAGALWHITPTKVDLAHVASHHGPGVAPQYPGAGAINAAP